MQGFCGVVGLIATLITGCSAPTQAAFVPQLDIGLRSVRSRDAHSSSPSQGSAARWDLTVFARLAWTSRRSADLIPSRSELSPDTWLEPCADQDCVWDTPDNDDASSASAFEATP